MKANYFFIPLVVVAVAAIGSIFTSSGMDWYQQINLPDFTPAGSVIGTVWTILFILSAIAMLLIWNRSRHDRYFRFVIFLFVLNAFLNIFWSFLFFNQHFVGAAFWEAGALALSVASLVIFSWPISKLSSLLLFPYFLWVSFATFLTYSVWILN